MDVIDSEDFVYTPLLYFEPGYIFSMNQHYGTTNVLAVLDSEPENILLSLDNCEIEYLPEPKWEDTWTKVEQALFGITLAPIGSKVISEADYFMCPEFKEIYEKFCSEKKRSKILTSFLKRLRH